MNLSHPTRSGHPCRWLPAFIAFTAITLFAGCSGRASPPEAAEVPPCCRPTPPSKPVSDRSLYQLESVWTSDAGKTIRLGHLQGRRQVVALFFSHCEYACPILVNDLQRIESALSPAAREKVDFLLVSIDPARDTPARLREFRTEKHLGTNHWTLLTGREDDVRELAAILGVNYQRDARGQYAHSNLITLLSPGGEILTQLKGLNQPVDDFVRQLSDLPNTPAGSPP